MKILFKNAYVLTMKDGEKPFLSDVLVEDKIIKKTPFCGVIDN